MSKPYTKYHLLLIFLFITGFVFCNKSNDTVTPVTPVLPPSFSFNNLKVNGAYSGFTYYNLNKIPVIKLSFSESINLTSISGSVSFKDNAGTTVAFQTSSENNDSTIIIQPSSSLQVITKYVFSVSTALQSKKGGTLQSAISINLITAIDSTDKFPQLSDSALLDLVQKQTFKYFWNFAHPVCGMALERSNGDNNIVTSGGTGFGIMAMIVAANRGFITRTDAVTRLNTIVNFLTTKCQRWHGAFSHWINGNTGATVAFGNNNGADIVETSYLMQGLLCARQYFNSNTGANEMKLRDSINSIWNNVDWNWFTKNEKSIYWQYNPSYTATSDVWSIAVSGWNEALITYALAASSTTHSIAKDVYDNGWAKNGSIKNGNSYYGVTLPLGPSLGGPLFFAHYSFLGINPNGLTDAYANYQTQNIAHTQINYNYCVANPQNYNGYSNVCWGLTASDDNVSGYSAHSPTNDLGIISPTAAISSLPYTPTQSMNAIRFFYYKLGDKIWKDYGFVDAFNLTNIWFAPSFLAIDQGPEIVMIENYRSGLLWNLFMSCPEVKTGMMNIGFSSPHF